MSTSTLKEKKIFRSRWEKRSTPLHVSPLVREFFSLLDKDPRTVWRFAEDAGLHTPTVWNWRRGKTLPRLGILNQALNALGYELVIQKKTVEFPTAPP